VWARPAEVWRVNSALLWAWAGQVRPVLSAKTAQAAQAMVNKSGRWTRERVMG
jgi:hypothetical protein